MNQYKNPSALTLRAALELVQRGFLVFPIYEPAADLNGCSCYKGQACNSPGKHPRTSAGFKDASLDPKQVEKWWTKYPDANIGLATGKASNVVVVDIDDRNDGPATLRALESETGLSIPPTLTVATGNGLHYYFLAPDQPLRSRKDALGRGIDLKAEGGYVVAPPSLHPAGRNYQFIDSDEAIAPLPSWIIEWLSQEGEASMQISEQSTILEGTRNNTLTSHAGQLRNKGAGLTEIRTELMTINRNRCQPPLPEYEVDVIAKSISRYHVGNHCNEGERDRARSAREHPLHWFRLNVIWWNGNINISQMDAEQIGWYVSLLVKAFPTGGMLPADIRILAKLANAKSTKAFERRCGLVLSEFDWQTDAGGRGYLIHRMLEDNYNAARETVDKNVLAGKASAEARKQGKASA